MTYFLFAGDMLVMLFMVVLVVWVSLRSSSAHMDHRKKLRKAGKYTVRGA